MGIIHLTTRPLGSAMETEKVPGAFGIAYAEAMPATNYEAADELRRLHGRLLRLAEDRLRILSTMMAPPM